MKKLNNKGFSLVELIIVIAIMAILVGVMAPQLMKWIEKSKYSSDIQTISTFESAVKTTMIDCASAGLTVPTTGDYTMKELLAPTTATDFSKTLKATLEGASELSFDSKAFDADATFDTTKTVHITADGVVLVAVPVVGTETDEYPNYPEKAATLTTLKAAITP